jgi:FtsZ-interacting cell division protein ZipA
METIMLVVIGVVLVWIVFYGIPWLRQSFERSQYRDRLDKYTRDTLSDEEIDRRIENRRREYEDQQDRRRQAEARANQKDFEMQLMV